jgi:hypothetical protein
MSNTVSCVRLPSRGRCIEIPVIDRSKYERALLTLNGGKEPVRSMFSDKSSSCKFDSPGTLLGNFPWNPQSTSWSDDKGEERFIKKLGTTIDMSTSLK